MRRLILLAAALCLAIPAMAQTPAPAQAPPADRAFVVFFQEWSAALDDSAAKVITDVAAIAKANPGHPVIIRGYADPTGTARANALISALRAELVANQLVADGVDASMVEQRALGATDFALNSQESRRVTITVGGS
jgi:outer membrane protein OmpA-like peptidoglycan-associated protein